MTPEERSEAVTAIHTSPVREERLAETLRPEWRRDAVADIHASPLRAVLMLAGGTAAIADLLGVPGGSRTVFEALAPYSRPALEGWLGYLPGNAVTEEVAADMATVAAKRAGNFAIQLAQAQAARAAAEDGTGGIETGGGNSSDVMLSEEALEDALYWVAGVAVTSALATDPPRRGEDRAWRAVARPTLEDDGSVGARLLMSTYLTFNATDRESQERQLADEVLTPLWVLSDPLGEMDQEGNSDPSD